MDPQPTSARPMAKSAKIAESTKSAQKLPAPPTPTPKNKGGRPLGISEDQAKRMITLLRAGNRLAVACSIVGISASTVSHMLLRYERGELQDPRGSVVCANLKRAQDYAEQVSIRKVRKGDKGWQAHAWYLERTRPQQYAQVQRIDLKAAIKDLRGLSDDELAALAGKAAAATGLVDMSTDPDGGFSAGGGGAGGK